MNDSYDIQTDLRKAHESRILQFFQSILLSITYAYMYCVYATGELMWGIVDR